MYVRVRVRFYVRERARLHVRVCLCLRKHEMGKTNIIKEIRSNDDDDFAIIHAKCKLVCVLFVMHTEIAATFSRSKQACQFDAIVILLRGEIIKQYIMYNRYFNIAVGLLFSLIGGKCCQK